MAGSDGEVPAQVIFVDTNVFVIALRYKRDRLAHDNARFLDLVRRRGDGVTSVVNVLETCGILSFDLQPPQLVALHAHFGRHFGLRVLPEDEVSAAQWPGSREILAVIRRRLSFGDALVVTAVERWAPEATIFASWDAHHFRGKLAPRVVTPADLLAENA